MSVDSRDTCVEFVPCVDSLMYPKVASLGEIFDTINAVMRLCSYVTPLICLKVGGQGERLFTEVAAVWFLLCVDQPVSPKSASLGE